MLKFEERRPVKLTKLNDYHYRAALYVRAGAQSSSYQMTILSNLNQHLLLTANNDS